MRVEIKPAEGHTGHKMLGRDVEILLDGEPLRGCARDVLLDLSCDEPVSLIVEYLIDDLDVDTDIDDALVQLINTETGKGKMGKVSQVDSDTLLALSKRESASRKSKVKEQ